MPCTRSNAPWERRHPCRLPPKRHCEPITPRRGYLCFLGGTSESSEASPRRRIPGRRGNLVCTRSRSTINRHASPATTVSPLLGASPQKRPDAPAATPQTLFRPSLPRRGKTTEPRVGRAPTGPAYPGYHASQVPDPEGVEQNWVTAHGPVWAQGMTRFPLIGRQPQCPTIKA
jgi:hypothetical protein